MRQQQDSQQDSGRSKRGVFCMDQRQQQEQQEQQRLTRCIQEDESSV